MSGFDNLMRTDEHIANVRMGYDAQRYASDRQTAQTIGQLPGQMQQIGMNEQAMAMQEKQVDADLRLQEVEIESQMQRQKMAMMLEMDTVDMSRQQLRALKLQNDAVEFDYKERVRGASKQVDELTKLNASIFSSNPELGLMAGYVPDMSSPSGFREDAEKAKEMLKSLGSGGSPEDRYSAQEGRQIASDILSRYTDLAGNVDMNALKANPDDWARYQAAQRYQDRFLGVQPGQGRSGTDPGTVMEDIQEVIGKAQDTLQGFIGGGSSGKGSPKPVGFSESTRQAAGFAAHVTAMEMGETWEKLAPEVQGKLAISMGRAVESLLKKKPNYDPVMAAQLVYQQFDKGGMEGAYFLRMADYDDNQIRSWLTSKGMDKKSVDSVMQRLDSYSETLGR